MTDTVATTQSVCPLCLARLEARLIQRGDTVFLEKTCAEHGKYSTAVWRGEPSFSSWVRPKIAYQGGPRLPSQTGCPYDCGLCAQHGQRTCTALVEITPRCNLRCPVCFADSGQGTDPDLETLRHTFRLLMKQTGGCNLQLSGGEPTMREDLPAVIEAAREAGFSFIQLNTNGIKLAEDPELAGRLKESGLSSVFLQFDSLRDEPLIRLRGKALFAAKDLALDAMAKVGIGAVLVPTLVPGINTEEVWEIVRFAINRLPHVRGVHFQPISYFGRFPKQFAPQHITLPELIRLLHEQSSGILQASDFHPPACEHALCSFSAKYLADEHGSLQRLGSASCDCSPQPALDGALKSIAVTARQWQGIPLNIPMADPQDDFDRFLNRARTHTFTISAMAFQDVWSLNLDRLQGCCIHVAQPDGKLIPFCSYNLTSVDGRSLYRPQPEHHTST